MLGAGIDDNAIVGDNRQIAVAQLSAQIVATQRQLDDASFERRHARGERDFDTRQAELRRAIHQFQGCERRRVRRSIGQRDVAHRVRQAVSSKEHRKRRHLREVKNRGLCQFKKGDRHLAVRPIDALNCLSWLGDSPLLA